jgi:hypothetical protein
MNCVSNVSIDQQMTVMMLIFYILKESLKVPSKPLTLDCMDTLEPIFRRACFIYQNASYTKMNGIKVVDKLLICKVK